MAAQCCNGRLRRGHRSRRFRPCLVRMAVSARAHPGSRRRVFLFGFDVGFASDQSNRRLKFSGDLQHRFAILDSTGLCCRAQAASPSRRRAENENLQIDRPRTERKICPFFDQKSNLSGGFRSFGHNSTPNEERRWPLGLKYRQYQRKWPSQPGGATAEVWEEPMRGVGTRPS
jgi:hypothetical protein